MLDELLSHRKWVRAGVTIRQFDSIDPAFGLGSQAFERGQGPLTEASDDTFVLSFLLGGAHLLTLTTSERTNSYGANEVLPSKACCQSS